ncbi:MAG: DeoR/GlpR family DNA-binding transcription regulator [Christensenellales bacterium]|jgi:DeoR/GlpR family transcriptional regulator of sugar metabolism
MLLKDRLEAIRGIITEEARVQVSALSRQFSVTEETIRRDLEKLEAEGLVSRTYGGAILNETKRTEGIQYFKRTAINAEAKKAIAKKAAACVKNSLTIGLDSSTTAMEVMRHLKGRDDVTVITNSAVAITELAQSKMKLFSTGGVLNKHSLSLQGNVAKQALSNYNIDIVLISCKGLSMEQGTSDSDEQESEVKRAMIAHANSVILLVDHSKFDKVDFVKVASLEQIDLIVTDMEPSREWKEKLASLSVDVLY